MLLGSSHDGSVCAFVFDDVRADGFGLSVGEPERLAALRLASRRARAPRATSAAHGGAGMLLESATALQLAAEDLAAEGARQAQRDDATGAAAPRR